jgi:hypothetical protein
MMRDRKKRCKDASVCRCSIMFFQERKDAKMHMSEDAPICFSKKGKMQILPCQVQVPKKKD